VASLHSIDVVVLDYLMPEMDGHEVAIRMNRLRPQAPIIRLSGAVDIPEEACGPMCLSPLRSRVRPMSLNAAR
jgi:CheY-like chemotaxis protein